MEAIEIVTTRLNQIIVDLEEKISGLQRDLAQEMQTTESFRDMLLERNRELDSLRAQNEDLRAAREHEQRRIITLTGQIESLRAVYGGLEEERVMNWLQSSTSDEIRDALEDAYRDAYGEDSYSRNLDLFRDKIPMIKALRAKFGMGLKSAKETYEDWIKSIDEDRRVADSVRALGAYAITAVEPILVDPEPLAAEGEQA